MGMFANGDPAGADLHELFANRRSWGCQVGDDSFIAEKTAYLDSVREILDFLSERGMSSPRRWTAQAARLAANVRADVTTFDYWSKFLDPVRALVESSFRDDADGQPLISPPELFLRTNKMLRAAADALVDRGLPDRDSLLARAWQSAAFIESDLLSARGAALICNQILSNENLIAPRPALPR